jgi:hypothetical protein
VETAVTDCSDSKTTVTALSVSSGVAVAVVFRFAVFVPGDARFVAIALPPCLRTAEVAGRDVSLARPTSTRLYNDPEPISANEFDTTIYLSVMTAEPADGRFDTSRGTIHLILGGGGTSAPLDAYGVNPSNGRPQAKVITTANRPVPGTASGTFLRHEADALEDAIWSARRDTDTGYGIAVLDLDPGLPRGKTSITIRYYHAPGADQMPTSNYELFETVVLAKDRLDTATPS